MKTTQIVLLSVSALLTFYDIWIYKKGGPSGTISKVVLKYSKDHPVIPFLVGVLAGHLWWPQFIRS